MSYENVIEKASEYKVTVEELQLLISKIIENGEITQDDNNDLESLVNKYDASYKDFKSVTENINMKLLDEKIERIKNNMVAATTKDILNVLTNNGRKNWLYKDNNDNVLVDATSIPELTIALKKLNLIATDGDNESEIILTPSFINLISNSDISLTAKNINLNGYINEGGNWSVDTDGNMEVENLNVGGYISTNELRVANIACSNLATTCMSDVVVYVNSTTTDDNSKFEDQANYSTLQGAIDAIPDYLNGALVTINLQKSVHEDILIKGINGGSLYINLGSNVSINGNLMIRDCNGRIALYGSKDANGNVISNIKPSNLIEIVNRQCSIVVQTSQFVALNNVNVYGKVHSTNNDYYYAVLSLDNSGTYFAGGKIIGCDNAFRTNSLGRLYIASSHGKVNNYVFRAVSGGIINVNNLTQCNSASATKYSADDSAIVTISSTFSKWDEETNVGDNDNVTETTKTITFNSIYGDYYREKYTNWKNNNTVRQGVYTVYGINRGAWFFGNQFESVVGKNIDKVTIKITRQDGGVSSAQTHTLRAHGYSTRPSTVPSYLSNYSQTFSLAVGNSTTVTITNDIVLNAIKSGTCKGFGLYNADGVYSVCSGGATVTITYK